MYFQIHSLLKFGLLYQLMLLFRSLGVIQLPNAAYYSAVLAPLSALSFYQFVLQ